MNERDAIIRIILEHYPKVQAIYLFGTYGTEDERPDSDLDIGVLLPPLLAKTERHPALNLCVQALAELVRKEVDLINIRQVSTVFQKEIITGGRLLYCADRYAVDEFEMLVLSYYQKLNEERASILDEALRSGRFYKP